MEEILKVSDLTRVYGRGSAPPARWTGCPCLWKRGSSWGSWVPRAPARPPCSTACPPSTGPPPGSIVIDGRELTGLRGKELSRFRRERLGFIFQDCNLLDTLTAFENIALALAIVKAPAGEIPGRVEEMARLLGIEDCLNKYPYQMSGGQQQRCAAARAMVTHPALVLADEPTGALDSKSARLLLERLEVLNQERGATILMVTHDAFTASCCGRVVFLRDGKLFLELRREGRDRKAFFQQIIRVVSQLGGEMEDVL